MIPGAVDGIQGDEEEDADSDSDADYDCLDWTAVINIPVQNVVEIALSTELDLAVVISCVFPCRFSSFVSHLTVQWFGPIELYLNSRASHSVT